MQRTEKQDQARQAVFTVLRTSRKANGSPFPGFRTLALVKRAAEAGQVSENVVRKVVTQMGKDDEIRDMSGHRGRDPRRAVWTETTAEMRAEKQKAERERNAQRLEAAALVSVLKQHGIGAYSEFGRVTIRDESVAALVALLENV
jgi:hypothetical protein